MVIFSGLKPSGWMLCDRFSSGIYKFGLYLEIGLEIGLSHFTFLVLKINFTARSDFDNGRDPSSCIPLSKFQPISLSVDPLSKFGPKRPSVDPCISFEEIGPIRPSLDPYFSFLIFVPIRPSVDPCIPFLKFGTIRRSVDTP